MAYDLIDLKLLVSVADFGTLGQAAAENSLSSSSASKRLANLELTFGTVLFVRHRRGLALTEAGQVVLRHARQVFAQLGQMNADFSPTAETCHSEKQ